MWLEVEGPWELNRQKEAEASVWEGAEMSLGFDWRRRASFSDDEQALATTSKLQRRRRANAAMVKATMASKSDDEQAKATSTANDLAETVNDSMRSSRMGIDKRDRCEWVRCWDVANGFGVGIVWLLRWAVRERVRKREK